MLVDGIHIILVLQIEKRGPVIVCNGQCAILNITAKSFHIGIEVFP
jgi:hypothetical protein